MTFNAAAWSIDGATINSALARTQAYAANSGDQGIVQFGDLVVSQLGTPGNGVQISAGSALILNGYQGAATDQQYTVTNPSNHIVPATDMPASNPSAKSYILAVVIGDPEFSQVGHPWMGSSDPAAGTEDTFIYVRPTMIAVAAGATSLSVGYPALPLARIDIPANTTTITNAMITSLRALARPRTQLVQDYVASGGTGTIISASYHRVGPTVLTVTVPKWAAKAKIQGFVEGLRLDKVGNAVLVAYVESNGLSTPQTNVNETSLQAVGDRKTYNVGGTIDVSTMRGTTQKFSVQGKGFTSPDDNLLRWDANTGIFLSVYFEEQPI